MANTTLIPNQQAPQLVLPTADGGTFNLKESLNMAENFHILLFYRGLHCPICKQQLPAWDSKMDEFAELGTNVTFVSSDTKEHAEKTAKEWGLENTQVAYGLSLKEAQEKWGLFISSSIKDGEPDYFSEPGLFIIKPNGQLYASAVQTMPFARPPLDEVLNALKFATKKNYPARGVVAEVPAEVSST